MPAHLLLIPFLFILGACIGSFLNVVVYRLPRGISLIFPASHCPHCQTRLGLKDNIPVFGWIFLKGKCRYCGKAISPRYPIIEAVTGLLFVFYYVMFFILHAGPSGDIWHASMDSWFIGDLTNLQDDWPIYFLDMALISGLLAASLIDAELFIIPAEIPWWIGGAAVVVHAILDRPDLPGNLMIGPASMALCAGSAIGMLISMILLKLKILPLSFPEGDLLEHERAELNQQAQAASKKGQEAPEIPPELTPGIVRKEIRKEVLFLMPALILGGLSVVLYARVPGIHELWHSAAAVDWLSAGLGSLLGGMIGGFIIWLTRILGSYGFGREAMGLGDIHLMFGVGAVLGGGSAAVAFFIAPFFAILWAVYIFFTRSSRQLPFGPFLSLATAFVMLFYSPIVVYYRPGLAVVIEYLRQLVGGR